MLDAAERNRPTITVRNAVPSDVPAIVAMLSRTYPDEPPYKASMVYGQISVYPGGQFVVERGGDIIGYAASFIIDEKSALGPHTWSSITGNGYAARHDPNGDWLYGMEVSVDPAHRRLRVGQRLYDARRQLCEHEELKGIVFGGRMPNWARRRRDYPDAMDYVDAVRNKKVKDPVVNFHLREGFEPIALLENYHPDDRASGGCATHMVWRNPYAQTIDVRRRLSFGPKESVRAATVQFQARTVESFEHFMGNVEYFVRVCSEYRSDFVVFPELFTLQLIALGNRRHTPAEAIEALTGYTPRFLDAMRDLAVSYNVNIVGGSHPTRTDDGEIQNVAYVFLRDGSVHAREKIHPTPDERDWWAIQGGDEISTIMTDCGPIGILICYDSEFPELARKLADEGARLIFVPYCTDSRQGYLRVRYCCQARAIENQLYVVMSGNVGNLPNVENMDIQYAQSAILTPCDFPFARDGVAAEASENVETVTIADLDLTNLAWARSEGTVRNMRDRRFDLYKTVWL